MEHFASSLVNSTCTFRIDGHLTARQHQAFRTVMEMVKNIPHGGVCILDLSRTTFIDSAGIGMILLAKDACARQGISLQLANPNHDIQQLFQIIHMDDLLKAGVSCVVN